MGEFLDDLRLNWDSSYWWADHQLLMMVLLGLLGLAFHGLHLLMDRKWGLEP
jgi:hypothetical protein